METLWLFGDDFDCMMSDMVLIRNMTNILEKSSTY